MPDKYKIAHMLTPERSTTEFNKYFVFKPANSLDKQGNVRKETEQKNPEKWI